jgi:hypothetical protein
VQGYHLMKTYHLYSNNKYIQNTRSQHLNNSAVDKITDVAFYLDSIDMGYSHHITIDTEYNGIPNTQQFLSSFLNKMYKWHKRHRIVFHYVWVLENVGAVGVHVHLLIHTCTKHFDRLNQKISNWLPFKRDDNKGNKYSNINISLIWDLEGIISYICKGIDNSIHHEHVYTKNGRGHQGRIYGRRWGMSRLQT